MISLAPEVRVTMLGVFAALAVAGVALIANRRIRPEQDSPKLRRRVRTWWVMTGLFIASIAWSPHATVTLLAFTSFLALKEFLSMTPTRRADRRVLFYAYLSVPIQYWLAACGWYGMFIVFIPVLMFVWLPTRMWMIGNTDGFLRAAGSLHWALMLTVFALSHAALLLVLEPGNDARFAPAYPSTASRNFAAGTGLLVFLLLMTELNDMFQYLWGKGWGGPEVAPRVAPGKTYAGLLGGVFTTVVIAIVLGPRLTILDTPRALLAGIIIAVGGFAGSLCLSALKRDLHIKNFGATLPGHGGVLDRADSLVFTAPLFFHFVYYCYG